MVTSQTGTRPVHFGAKGWRVGLAVTGNREPPVTHSIGTNSMSPASREMLDRRWANVVTYVGATSANDFGPMWICPSVQRWHNVVTPPTMTLCQRFANVITYCILLYFMVIGTTFAQYLYEWLTKHWHNFMKQWCPLYVFLYSYSLSPIACRRLRLR